MLNCQVESDQDREFWQVQQQPEEGSAPPSPASSSRWVPLTINMHVSPGNQLKVRQDLDQEVIVGGAARRETPMSHDVAGGVAGEDSSDGTMSASLSSEVSGLSSGGGGEWQEGGGGMATGGEEGVVTRGEEGVVNREEGGVVSGGEEGVVSRGEEGVVTRGEEGVVTRGEEGVVSRGEEGVVEGEEGVVEGEEGQKDRVREEEGGKVCDDEENMVDPNTESGLTEPPDATGGVAEAAMPPYLTGEDVHTTEMSTVDSTSTSPVEAEDRACVTPVQQPIANPPAEQDGMGVEFVVGSPPTTAGSSQSGGTTSLPALEKLQLHLEKQDGEGALEADSSCECVEGSGGVTEEGEGEGEEEGEEGGVTYELSMVVSHVREPWMETQGNLVAHIRVGPTYHGRKEVCMYVCVYVCMYVCMYVPGLCGRLVLVFVLLV